jgi:putative endonuclease
MSGFMCILLCANGSFYTGSTTRLKLRISQHQHGEGANFTRYNLPVKLVCFEQYSTVSKAFDREKQVQGWRRVKKLALIYGHHELLPELAQCYSQKSKGNQSEMQFLIDLIPDEPL